MDDVRGRLMGFPKHSTHHYHQIGLPSLSFFFEDVKITHESPVVEKASGHSFGGVYCAMDLMHRTTGW